MKLDVRDLGHTAYQAALDQQTEAAELRAQEQSPDTLFFVEHPPVITLGRGARLQDILLSEAERRRLGVEVHRVSRGGLVTYHGPGQLVGYPIVHLYERARQVKQFVYRMEEVFVHLLGEEYGISAYHHRNDRGIWVGSEKIAAIGIAVKNRVTFHGFAFNVSTDLSHFGWIVPCGITDRGQTSLERLLGTAPPMSLVKRQFAEYFAREFGYSELSFSEPAQAPGDSD